MEPPTLPSRHRPARCRAVLAASCMALARASPSCRSPPTAFISSRFSDSPLSRTLAPYAPLSMRLVETEVKEAEKKVLGVGAPVKSSKGKLRAAGDELPPIPRDSFQHHSNALVAEECGPYWDLGKYKINAFGVWFMLQSILFAVPWAMALGVGILFRRVLDWLDPVRESVDLTSQLWAKGWMLTTACTPELSGLDNIPLGPAVRTSSSSPRL
jgi:hypothetical protein